VERIRGPVLLVTRNDDKVWPAGELTACALRRWEANAFPHEVGHLAYEDAGHSLGWPHVMTTVMSFRHPVRARRWYLAARRQGLTMRAGTPGAKWRPSWGTPWRYLRRS